MIWDTELFRVQLESLIPRGIDAMKQGYRERREVHERKNDIWSHASTFVNSKFHDFHLGLYCFDFVGFIFAADVGVD